MAAVAAVGLLQTRGLCKTFGGLQAVRNVDFSVFKGEVHALIGPNGAGKTTLVSLLSGRIAPTEGGICFLGEDITTMPAWRRVQKGIAYTFQITSIYPTLTVYENIAIAAQSRCLNRASLESSHSLSIDGSAYEALARVGLQRRAMSRAGELAYGHQRLLEVAMGLALKPSLLILDEPTQGLSDSENEVFIALIKDIRKQTTVLLIEHNMPVVMSLASRITVLDQGSILADGSPGEIRANDRVQAAYLGG